MKDYGELVREAIKKAHEDAASTPARFVVGKTYAVTPIWDSSARYYFTVVKRTAKTVTLESRDFPANEGVKVSRINADYTAHRNAETVFPFGRYSMCPILSADLAI